jgi:hypothetical protein
VGRAAIQLAALRELVVHALVPARELDGSRELGARGMRIPVKPITLSGVEPITESGQADHLSERSDAGCPLCL